MECILSDKETTVKKGEKQLPRWFYEQDGSNSKTQEEAVDDEELMKQLQKLREQHER